MRISHDDVTDYSTWPVYKKKAATPALHIEEFTSTGEVTVETKEGEYILPDGWDGYIAVDPDGDPYPIEGKVFKEVYEPID